jgi:hypothetical protein
VSITYAVFCFIAGLIPLWTIYQKLRLSGLLLSSLILAYFLVQHISFGLGGVFIALFDDGYRYINLKGDFFYTDGLQRVILWNLVALYAALAGFYAKDVCLWILGVHTRTSLSESKNIGFARYFGKYKKELLRIGLVSLGIHTVVLLFQWACLYINLGVTFTYAIQLFVKVTPSAFFFIGLLFPHNRKIRLIFIIYFVTYGILQFSTGGRAPVLYGFLIFLFGILCSSPNWIFSKFSLILIAASFVAIPYLTVQSENIRLLRQSRVPENLQDISKSLKTLFFAAEIPLKDSWGVYNSQSLNSSMFRFGARILEVAALDVALKTPEHIPHVGWVGNEFIELAQRMPPVFIMPDNLNRVDERIFSLKEYGWAVNPSGGTSFPLTLLGDAWSRFGWLGIIGIHFSLAVILTMIPHVLGGQKKKLFGIVITGPLVYMISFSYTNDLIGILVMLPRAVFLSGVYALILCFIGSNRVGWQIATHKNGVI